MSLRKENRPSWLRFSGIGIEFAGAVGGFTAIGYLFDRHYDSNPWGLLVGVFLGLIGGTYNLIRESLYAARQQQNGPPSGRSHEKEDRL